MFNSYSIRSWWLHYYILQVTATDADLGENGEVRYFLPADLTNNNLAAFGLNQYTGDIVVRELTEDDKDKHYLLTVIAVDRGNSELFTSMTSTEVELSLTSGECIRIVCEWRTDSIFDVF